MIAHDTPSPSCILWCFAMLNRVAKHRESPKSRSVQIWYDMMRIEENGVSQLRSDMLFQSRWDSMISGSERCFCGVFSLVRCALPQSWGRFGSPSNREAGKQEDWSWKTPADADIERYQDPSHPPANCTVSWELDSSSLYAAVYGIQSRASLRSLSGSLIFRWRRGRLSQWVWL